MILRYCTGKYERTVVHYDEVYAKTHEKVDLYSTVEACPVQAISALNASVVFLMFLYMLKAAAAAPARDVGSGVQNAMRCGNLCLKRFTWRAVFNLTEFRSVLCGSPHMPALCFCCHASLQITVLASFLFCVDHIPF